MELRHLRYFAGRRGDALRPHHRAPQYCGPDAQPSDRRPGSLLGTGLFTRRTKSAVGLPTPANGFWLKRRKRCGRPPTPNGSAAAPPARRRLDFGRLCALGQLQLIVPRPFRIQAPPTSRFNWRGCRPSRNSKRSSTARSLFPLSISNRLDRLHRAAAHLPGAPAGHPLAARKQITPAMLVGEPVVATSLEMEIGFWSNSVCLHRRRRAWFERAKSSA